MCTKALHHICAHNLCTHTMHVYLLHRYTSMEQTNIIAMQGRAYCGIVFKPAACNFDGAGVNRTSEHFFHAGCCRHYQQVRMQCLTALHTPTSSQAQVRTQQPQQASPPRNRSQSSQPGPLNQPHISRSQMQRL